MANYYKEENNPKMVDLTGYGALEMPAGIKFTFTLNNGNIFNFKRGVYIVKECIEEMVEYMENDGPPPPPRLPVEYLIKMSKIAFLQYIETEDQDVDEEDYGESDKVLYCVLKSLQNAIRKYHTQKRIRKFRSYTYLLMCMNSHYKMTMEKSYAIYGPGYYRLIESTKVGVSS